MSNQDSGRREHGFAAPAASRVRRLIGVVSLVALVVIALGVSGFELPGFRSSGAAEPAVFGVREVASAPLVSVGAGAPNGEFAFLAIEPSGNLVVTDRVRKSILRFDATGHLLSEWGPRLGDLTLDEPAGVAVDGDVVYVLDRATPRIVRLDAAGRVQRVISLQEHGTYGLNGLAIDAAHNVYAADTGRNRLLSFSPSGALVRSIGRGGTGLGEFTQPMMVAFLPDGGFVVADWENARLERWDAAPAALDAWSTGFRPFGVATDRFGRIYAPDNERRRVVAYAPRGDTLGELPVDVVPRQVATSLALPNALYVLGGDRVVRVDLENTVPIAQGRDDVDLLSPAIILLLVALTAVAVFTRRRRERSVGAALDGEVRLDAVNGAQRQQQQADADQDLLVAHQADRKQ